MIDRRRFLFLGGIAAAAPGAVIAGCGDDEEDTSREDAADVRRLNEFRAVQLGEAEFFAAIAALLGGPALEAAERFGAQSKQQASLLVTPVEDLGGKVRELTPAQQSAQRQLASRARSEADALDLAVRTKNSSLATYFEAIPKLFNDDLRRTAGALITCSSEQRAVLIGLQSGNDPQRQSESNFVTGAPQ